MKNKKHLYIEALRILACIAVVYNHVPRLFLLFNERDAGSAIYFADMAVSISCKFAVPLFFAISGALMLDREISLKQIWLQKIPKMLLTLAVFSVISYASFASVGKEVWDLKIMIFQAYDRDLNYAFWFLYAYIAFLMGMPMLSALLRGLKNREILYMIGLAVFFRSVLPAFEQMRWGGAHHLNSNINVSWLTVDVVLYPTIGYYMHNRMDVRACKQILPFLWIASAVGLYVSCVLTWREYLQTWAPAIEKYHNLFGGIYAAAVFATVRVLYQRVECESRLGRWTLMLSGLTFGIYLVHVPIKDNTALFEELIWISLEALSVPQFIAGLIYMILLLLVSIAVVLVLKKIPGIRSLLK